MNRKKHKAMKVVAEYYLEYEAEIAKGRLESEGISAVVMNLNSSYPGVQMGKHGIQVMVNDEDLEAARAILAEPAEDAENAEDAESAGDAGDAGDAALKCTQQ